MQKKRKADREIRLEIDVPAKVADVWEAWTTEQGIKSFFAPECNVELRSGGPYEILFHPQAEPGDQGGEGMIVLALQERKMLSVTWNAPPHIPLVRGQMTQLLLRFRKSGKHRTHLTLIQSGWGVGGEWDEAFDYFVWAWERIVLPRLVYRFKNGPVDWKSPPALEYE